MLWFLYFGVLLFWFLGFNFCLASSHYFLLPQLKHCFFDIIKVGPRMRLWTLSIWSSWSFCFWIHLRFLIILILLLLNSLNFFFIRTLILNKLLISNWKPPSCLLTIFQMFQLLHISIVFIVFNISFELIKKLLQFLFIFWIDILSIKDY